MAGIVAVSRDVGTAGLRSSCQGLQKANLTVRCPLPNPLPRGEGIEDAEAQSCFGFPADLSLLPAGEGVEDAENQPFLDFQPILSPLTVGEG